MPQQPPRRGITQPHSFHGRRPELSPHHHSKHTHHNREENKHQDGAADLIDNAVRLSKIPRTLRRDVAVLLRTLDKIDACSDPSTPPQEFRDALRKPRKSKRRTIKVCVNDRTVPLLLNPQGRIDPDREQQVWDYVRGLVRDGVK